MERDNKQQIKSKGYGQINYFNIEKSGALRSAFIYVI